jgi:WS/DGAT/MGAT family acyltransferase
LHLFASRDRFRAILRYARRRMAQDGSAYQRLSAQDGSFVLFEGPGAPMHLSAVVIFETGSLTNGLGGLDIERFRAHVAARLPERGGYRQRLGFTPLGRRPVWVDDAGFDLRRHVRHVALPPPGDDAQLRELSGQILSHPLDRDRPLWEMWVVENLSGGRFAVIAKLHHSLVDGIAGIGLVQALLSGAPETESGPAPEYQPEPQPGFAEQLLNEAGHALSGLGAVGSALLNPWTATERASSGLSALWDTAQRGLRLPPTTPINGPHGTQRRIDWGTLDLHEIHDLRKRLDGTVNDVVLAVVSGALRRFFRARGVPLKDLEFRVTVPVNLRGEDEARIGNRVGALFIDLPLSERDPRRRFATIRDRTRDAKGSRCAEGIDAIHRFLDWSHADPLVGLGSRLVYNIRPHNMVVTSIPGPSFPLYLLESRLLELHPQLPLFANQGLGVAAASYCGKVHIDWVAAWDLVPDLDLLTDALEPAFDELREAAARGNGRRRRPRSAQA